MTAAPARPDRAKNWNRRRHPVVGICLHWTGGTFASAVDWCWRAESQVSYHAIISPRGQVALVAPWEARAWAIGRSRSSDPTRLPYPADDANSVFESIALAGGPPVKPTPEAVAKLIALVAERFRARGWSAGDVWRITTHRAEAWERGRKHDPDGEGWLDVEAVRKAVADTLTAGRAA